MRQRSTFILDPNHEYDPSAIEFQSNSLSFDGLQAAREERLTFGLHQIPSEVVDLLEISHELHIRWTSERQYAKVSPYLSSLIPGLHVHYTPLKNDDGKICQLLHKAFSPSLRCTTTEDTFSRPHILSERFASAASLQYYSILPSLSHFVTYIQESICHADLSSGQEMTSDCHHAATLMGEADYIDIDYDSISHTLVFTAFFAKPTHNSWNIAYNSSSNDKIELGIFESSVAADPYDLQLEGLLAVVGQDQEPKSTIFFFPSRHHILNPSQSKDQEYSISFEQPTGLHPKMQIYFPSAELLEEPTNKPGDSTCALHAYLTLPSVLFVDEYAFPGPEQLDPLFTEAHNILSLRAISGELDLEAPDYVISKWGSAMLLELATPESTEETTEGLGRDQPWNITLPLHLRYLAPNKGGIETVTIPNPILFWACTAEEGTKFTVNPFDRVNLGYDGLFGPRTMFYHIEPKFTGNGPDGSSESVQKIQVPVLDTSYLSHGQIEFLTMTVVLAGFLWVALKVSKQLQWDIDWWMGKQRKQKTKSS